MKILIKIYKTRHNFMHDINRNVINWIEIVLKWTKSKYQTMPHEFWNWWHAIGNKQFTTPTPYRVVKLKNNASQIGVRILCLLLDRESERTLTHIHHCTFYLLLEHKSALCVTLLLPHIYFVSVPIWVSKIYVRRNCLKSPLEPPIHLFKLKQNPRWTPTSLYSRI